MNIVQLSYPVSRHSYLIIVELINKRCAMGREIGRLIAEHSYPISSPLYLMIVVRIKKCHMRWCAVGRESARLIAEHEEKVINAS
jgi:hypothetical protein